MTARTHTRNYTILTDAISGFLSHYLIRDRYGRPGKGNDKVWRDDQDETRATI